MNINFVIKNIYCSSKLRGAAMLVTTLLAGCASVPQGAGFPDVQQQLSTRMEQKVQWNQDTEQDKAVAQAVQVMLQDELTADEAVQIALLNNHLLQAEYEKLGIAQADLVQAGLLGNPVFSGEVMRSGVGIERTVGVMLDFLNIFTVAARERVAKESFEQVKLLVANRAFDLATEVRAVHYAIEGDEQALELFQTATQATEAAADLAQRQYRAGGLNRLGQTQQQAFYAQTLLELARAEAHAQRDREKLNRLMGLWGADVNWKTSRRLPETPAVLTDWGGLESQAVTRRLDLAAAQKEAEALSAALDFNRRYGFLSVFGIGFTKQSTGDDESLNGPNIEFGVPLFDQGQARGARMQSELRSAERRRDALAVDIRSQVRDARNRLAAAHGAARHLREVLLPLNEQIVRETQLRYNGMLLGVYDLLLAKQNQLNVARDYIKSLRDYWIAYAELERAVGGRLKTEDRTPQPPVPNP